jgi:hypothetical protein
VKHWLRRAVDQTGIALDVPVQSGRDKQAAGWLLRKLSKKQMRPPRVTIADKPASQGAAKREIVPRVEHRQHKGLDNRAENSHQPTRQRKWRRQRFKSTRHAQRFLSAHDRIATLFHLRRYAMTSVEHRAARTRACQDTGTRRLGRNRRCRRSSVSATFLRRTRTSCKIESLKLTAPFYPVDSYDQLNEKTRDSFGAF